MATMVLAGGWTGGAPTGEGPASAVERAPALLPVGCGRRTRRCWRRAQSRAARWCRRPPAAPAPGSGAGPPWSQRVSGSLEQNGWNCRQRGCGGTRRPALRQPLPPRAPAADRVAPACGGRAAARTSSSFARSPPANVSAPKPRLPVPQKATCFPSGLPRPPVSPLVRQSRGCGGMRALRPCKRTLARSGRDDDAATRVRSTRSAYVQVAEQRQTVLWTPAEPRQNRGRNNDIISRGEVRQNAL